MDEDYIKNKYIEDLNKEELIWISNNSYINYWVFNGRAIQLEEKEYKKSIYLSKMFNGVKKIENLYFDDFIYDKNFILGQEIYKQFFKLYIEIGKNFNNFISDINNIEEFINLYIIVSDIQSTAVKDFYAHNKKYLQNINKKYHKYLRYPVEILDDAWRIWFYPCIREPLIANDNYKHVTRYGMSLCENGEYEKALQFFQDALKDDTNVIHEQSQRKSSILYYELIILYKLNHKEEFKEKFDLYKEYLLQLAYKDIIFSLKLIDIYMILYEFGNIQKEELENNINNILYRFFIGFNTKESVSWILNGYKLRSYRHEHIGEIICNMKTYYNYLKFNKPFYYLK